ncbi:hypothetical protein B9Q08_01860 [Candidatus Marsarchaeota G2 archaeon ECH_B_SAG-M15]|uniref:Citrate synthase n=1 Tax=Candidatus Marsarchaeota G2 archaeon ECH_B_SAG-M15 TaxID=1978162 RepID=A0A2R6B053_9ARCH|nr:MAG: hypothetical protein B9Q08_01860 [Candidatus Marsarchaeota G2 archaeon ECH_B_SAG-M15]
MSSENTVVLHKGLDNVYVAESSICYIDGENSKLFYRGYSVEDLAQRSTFEEVAFLLIYGWLPKREEFEGFVRTLRESYTPPQEVLAWLKTLPSQAHPMDVLRTAISMLSLYDRQGVDGGLEANRLRGLRVIGVTPTIIASFARIRRGVNPVEPKMDLPIASNFLYMLRGTEPDAFDASVMDKAMILHAEHEMNASTFSCIVTASSLIESTPASLPALSTTTKWRIFLFTIFVAALPTSSSSVAVTGFFVATSQTAVLGGRLFAKARIISLSEITPSGVSPFSSTTTSRPMFS